MRKTITLLTILLFVVFMVGCENSINPIEPNNNQEISLAKQSNPDEAVSNLAKGGRNVKVELCHLTGNGKYVIISVDESAVQAHLDHGDLRTLLVEGDLDLLHPQGGDDGEGRVSTFEVHQSCDGTISGFLHWEQTSGGALYTHDITVDTFTDYGNYVEFSGISVSTPAPGKTGDRLIIIVDDDPQVYSNKWEGKGLWTYDIANGTVIIY